MGRYDFNLLNWDAPFLSVILTLLSTPQMNSCEGVRLGRRAKLSGEKEDSFLKG
jgi:hypothetical protein